MAASGPLQHSPPSSGWLSPCPCLLSWPAARHMPSTAADLQGPHSTGAASQQHRCCYAPIKHDFTRPHKPPQSLSQPEHHSRRCTAWARDTRLRLLGGPSAAGGPSPLTMLTYSTLRSSPRRSNTTVSPAAAAAAAAASTGQQTSTVLHTSDHKVLCYSCGAC
jgi:hypothetical protein